MIDFTNIIISVCISILVYLLLDFIDNIKESFDQYNFNCMSQNDFIYTINIKTIKENLENDGYLSSDIFESERLLEIYDILLCDLQNLNKNNLYEMKIISNLQIIVDTDNIIEFINKIFNKLNDTTTEIITKISKISYEETREKYLKLNTVILENIKQEILMKVL